MGKLAYFFTTFVGAVPAGLGLALLIMEVFLKRTEALSTMLLAICIVIAVCLALVVMTPFMVLVFYKDTRPKLAAAGAGVVAAGAGVVAAGSAAASEPAGFDDAIPNDYDEEELAASAGDDDDYGDYEGADYTEDAEGDYDEDDYDDFEDLDF